MPVALAISYELLLLALGYWTLSLVRGNARSGLVETFGLAQVLGTGNMGLLLLLASLVGFAPSGVLLGCVAGAVCVGLTLQWQRKRLPQVDLGLGSWRGWDWLLLAPVLLIVYLLAVVTLHALALPLYEWDAFAIWGLKAKVLTHETLAADPAYFHDASLSFSHPDYPLLLPFLTSGVYGVLGQVDDRLGKIFLPPLFLAYGAILYAALRWKLRRNPAILLTAAGLALPLCVRWAGAGYADVLLTTFYAGSIFCLIKWIEEERGADLALAACFSIYAALTKSEGLALAIINGVVLVVFVVRRLERRRVVAGALFLGGVFVALLPWLIWSRHLARTHEASLGRLAAGWGNLGTVARAFAAELTNFAQWSGVWLLVALAAIAGRRAFRLRGVQALWVLFAAHLALYALVYAATTRDVRELLTLSLDRVLLHLTPAAIWLVGYHWASLAASTPRPAPARPITAAPSR